MGDEDLYVGDVRNYYNTQRIIVKADEKDFYKHSSKRKGYVIPYNSPLNTRRGFRTIYYLMKLSQHDMTTVIKDIIAVRHAGINFILNICDKLEKENNCMLTSLRGG